MKGNKPSSVGDILASLADTSQLGECLDQARIWEHWTELVGPYLGEHGAPKAVKERTLVIEAESPVWMSRFSFRKWDILKRINLMAGRELISDVFITLAPEDEPAPARDK